jgi:hypothetical protein
VRALGGSGSSAGGIVGRQYDNPISNSYFNGNVYGPVWAGGISGYLDGTITNSYSTGLVNCSYAVGGIVAIIDNGASISNSFTTSSVIGSLNKKGIASVIWSGSINSSYWDTYLTGQSTCFKDISSVDRNTGCVSTNNSASSYYGSNGIPFDNLNWSTSIWTSRANNYPVLSWQ